MFKNAVSLSMVLISFILIGVLILFNLNNFPTPTGNYAVGKINYHLVDASRVETNNPSAKREIMVHIWYPTSKQTNFGESYYDKDALSTVQGFINQQGNIPLWLLKGISFTKTYSQENAPVSESKDSYPVIIATHGTGTMVQHYTSLWEELASHGYIVVGIDHPYMAALTRFPDGRGIASLINAKRKETKEAKNTWKQEQFEVAVADVRFVLDSLTELNSQPKWPLYNRLNLSHVGMCAHSSGGSLAMRVSLEDKRIKAVAALDSSARGNYSLTPLSTPTLLLLAEKSHVLSGEEGRQALQDLKTLCYRSKPFITLITFNSIGHGAFTDLPSLLHSTLLTQFLSKFINVDIDASSSQAVKAMEEAKRYVISFFDRYLKDNFSSLMFAEGCDENANTPVN